MPAQTDQEQTAKRYAPTTVRRSIYSDGTWVEIESYDDATVQSVGQNHRLDAKEAMLRAYSPDPLDESVYGDEEEREGAGVHLNTSEHYGESAKGYVLDCDGDIAVKRIMMNAVLSVSDYGHGDLTYTGIVSFEDVGAWGSGTREVNEWTGFGGLEQIRLEQWSVRIKKDKKSSDDED
jgi:hypothetical protein